DVVDDPVHLEAGIELAPAPGGDVPARVAAHHGAEAARRTEGARVHGVEGGDRAQPAVPAPPGDGETASHAEADDPDARPVDLRLGDQEVRGGPQVGDRELLAADHRLAHQAG